MTTSKASLQLKKKSDVTTNIVGIDCATQPEKVGVARAIIQGNTCRIIEALRCSATESPASIVARWHQEAPVSLLALDAPLGWPSNMATTLVTHQAGEQIAVAANELFHRRTDDEIEKRLGKRPLEVGANLIARTAKSALDLLHNLRDMTGESIPLAWEMGVPQQLSAIEVYPAATWRSLSSSLSSSSAGKSPQKGATRSQIMEKIAQRVDVPAAVANNTKESAHTLDAILCVVAAFEFVSSRCAKPDDPDLARKEGWIWVR